MMQNTCHPYHLVEPSPWPAYAAFFTTAGGVMYFHVMLGINFSLNYNNIYNDCMMTRCN